MHLLSASWPLVCGLQPVASEFRRPTVKTILLVDSDLGFIFWLGHVLDAAGYIALPAKSVPDAIVLLVQHRLTISLLVLNSSLAGAASLVEVMRNLQARVKIIGINTAEGDTGGPLQGIDISRPKPERIDERTTRDWLHLTKRVLSPVE